MLKKFIVLFFLGLSFNSFGQQKLLHDSLKIDNSNILIATSSEHKDFEFCITKPKEIAKVLGQLTYGKSKKAPYEKNPVVVKLVSNGLIVQTWIVKPKASVIEINDVEYTFDPSKLLKLAKKYPFRYNLEEKDFDDEAQLSSYYTTLLKDKSFLYIAPPDFDNQWQGKFLLTFNKSELINSPLAIANYLRPKFELIEKKKKFSITYDPFDVGKDDDNKRFTMTIYGTKKLYQEFTDNLGVKGVWQPFPYTAYILKRK